MLPENILNKDKLQELRNQGKTRAEIADIFGVSVWVVESNIKFYAVCSNVETGKAEYIHCKELRQGRGINYIRASASLPFFSKKSRIH